MGEKSTCKWSERWRTIGRWQGQDGDSRILPSSIQLKNVLVKTATHVAAIFYQRLYLFVVDFQIGSANDVGSFVLFELVEHVLESALDESKLLGVDRGTILKLITTELTPPVDMQVLWMNTRIHYEMVNIIWYIRLYSTPWLIWRYWISQVAKSKNRTLDVNFNRFRFLCWCHKTLWWD